MVGSRTHWLVAVFTERTEVKDSVVVPMLRVEEVENVGLRRRQETCQLKVW